MNDVDVVGSLARAAMTRRPRMQLVIVTRHDERCDCCGGDLLAGTEAMLWLGGTKAHVGCALGPCSPKGGS